MFKPLLFFFLVVWSCHSYVCTTLSVLVRSSEVHIFFHFPVQNTIHVFVQVWWQHGVFIARGNKQFMDKCVQIMQMFCRTIFTFEFCMGTITDRNECRWVRQTNLMCVCDFCCELSFEDIIWEYYERMNRN